MLNTQNLKNDITNSSVTACKKQKKMWRQFGRKG